MSKTERLTLELEIANACARLPGTKEHAPLAQAFRQEARRIARELERQSFEDAVWER